MRRLLPVSVRFAPDSRVEGFLVDVEENKAHVELRSEPRFAVEAGQGVVVYPEGERNLEMVGVVVRLQARELVVSLARSGHREDRWSPREQGNVPFRIRAVGADDEAWFAPDPHVELALSGLAFLHPLPPPEAELEVELRRADGPCIRLRAEVVRVDPTRRPELRRVSLAFIEVSDSAGAALADLLSQLQDEALEALGGRSTLDLPPLESPVAEHSE